MILIIRLIIQSINNLNNVVYIYAAVWQSFWNFLEESLKKLPNEKYNGKFWMYENIKHDIILEHEDP